jgi:hypothetical protein
MKTNNEKMMTKSDTNTSSNKDNSSSSNASRLPSSPSPRSSLSSADNNNKIENVLVLQGGGSLGAFGCGVLKYLQITT